MGRLVLATCLALTAAGCGARTRGVAIGSAHAPYGGRPAYMSGPQPRVVVPPVTGGGTKAPATPSEGADEEDEDTEAAPRGGSLTVAPPNPGPALNRTPSSQPEWEPKIITHPPATPPATQP